MKLDSIYEYFDITDNETRKVLLNINEEDQSQMAKSLGHKLYDNIIDKVDKIDYGSIPDSKGDITKIENFTRLTECLSTMEGILLQYKQSTMSTDIIKDAIENIKNRTHIWQKAYNLNIELPIVLYNTIVLSIVSSLSFLISSTIDFIKSPGEDSFEVSINSVGSLKTKDNLLFKNLSKFNDTCHSGELDKCLDYVMKSNSKQLLGSSGGIIIGSALIITLITNIIPIMRELIFFFYNTRQSVSDYFAIQADLLQMNAENIRYNSSKSSDEKKKIRQKQLKVVNSFRKISNVLAIKSKKAEKDAAKDINSIQKKYKIKDITDVKYDSYDENIEKENDSFSIF